MRGLVFALLTPTQNSGNWSRADNKEGIKEKERPDEREDWRKTGGGGGDYTQKNPRVNRRVR